MKYFSILYTFNQQDSFARRYQDFWIDKDIESAKTNWSKWNLGKYISKIEEINKEQYQSKVASDMSSQTLFSLQQLISVFQEYRNEIFDGPNDPDWFVEENECGTIFVFYWEGDKKISIPFDNFIKLMWSGLKESVDDD